MGFSDRLPATLFGVAATIALVQPALASPVASPTVSPALSAAQVNEVARQVTVKIDGPTPGSGVIIARQEQTYFVLTAAQVVTTPREYSLVTPDSKKYSLDPKLVRKFPDTGLTLVQFNSPENYRVATIGSSTQLNDAPAYIAGFSQERGKTAGSTYRFTAGQILAQATQPVGKGYTLAYQNDTFAGMGGGPIFNQQGQLIGVHGASQARFTSSQGVNPRSAARADLSLGIPISAFLRGVPKVMPGLSFPDAPVAPAVNPAAQTTAADLFVQAVNRSLANRRKEALVLLERAIKTQANNGSAYFYRGMLTEDINQKSAIADYSQTIRLSPDFASAYARRGLVRARLKDYAAAIADFDQALRLNPADADAYFSRGSVRTDLKDYPLAIADYDQAIRLNPNFFWAYINRAAARLNLKDYPSAVADYDQALRLDPDFFWAYTNRAAARLNLKDYATAIADYNQAIRLSPNSAMAFSNRGSAHADLKNYPAAIADYTQAIRLNPNSASAYNNRGLARARLKDYAAAVADYTQAIRLNPGNADAYFSRGNARVDLKEYPAAIADYTQAIRLNPSFADAYFSRANVRVELKDFASAVADFDQAIRLNPNDADAYFRRAHARIKLGDQQGAAADWQKAATLAQAQGDQQVYGDAMRNLELIREVP